MPLQSICVDCGDLVDTTIESRCAECLPAHRDLKARRRLALEPWRRVYTTPEWRACTQRVFKRDGNRCRVIEDGARCTVTTGLQGHHHPAALSDLWLPDRDWAVFVRIATDPARVITTCASHNAQLDAARRRAPASARRPGRVPAHDLRRLFYASPEWKQTRATIIERDAGICALCGSAERPTVHHRQAINEGGHPLDENNLETLCASCHGSVDAPRSQPREQFVHADTLTIVNRRIDEFKQREAGRAERRQAREAYQRMLVERLERGRQAAALRREGRLWREIAATLGFATAGAAYAAARPDGIDVNQTRSAAVKATRAAIYWQPRWR
jgi:5-methylcytosine-specific restriction endonuclease McrA